MEKKIPLCRKCSSAHYNIWSCERAAEMRRKQAALEERKKAKKVVPVYRNDGAQTWRGDKLDSFTKSGNTLWRKGG